MRLLRSIVAIGIGLAFMAATTTVWAIVAKGAANPYANLAVTGVGAVIGGWLTARAAPGFPYAHAAALAALVAVIALPSATGPPLASQPGWYPAAIALIAVLGVLLGGKLRAAAASAEGSVRAFRPGEQRE
jgi:hypothetical protein